MKHQRVKGLYFLFTLGFLLVFSSGFVAFLAWDGPGYQGSAAALEQPVTPPSLDSRAGKQPVPKAHAGAKPAATLESPEPQAPVEIPGESAGQTATPTEEVKPANEQAASPKAKPIEAKVEPPVKVESNAKADKTAVPSGHAVQSEKKVAAAKDQKVSETKPRKKTRKSVRTPPVVVDETKVPPEWNWFAAPLRMSLTDHKVEILSDVEQVPHREIPSMEAPATVEEKVPEVSLDTTAAVQEPVAATESEKESEPASSVVPFTSLDESKAYAQRLNNILARLQERREKRTAEAKAHALVLPSQKSDIKTGNPIEKQALEGSEGETLPAADTDAEATAADGTEGLPPLPADYPAGNTVR